VGLMELSSFLASAFREHLDEIGSCDQKGKRATLKRSAVMEGHNLGARPARATIRHMGATKERVRSQAIGRPAQIQSLRVSHHSSLVVYDR
jgi:hypothetical protein